MTADTDSLSRKRAFILLRYAFIIAAAYLILFEGHAIQLDRVVPLLILGALLSNVLLNRLSDAYLFGWGTQVAVLVADTLWISYSLLLPGRIGQQFFLLYFFVLTLAAVGESLATALIGALLVGVVDFYFSLQDHSPWTSPSLIRIPFFFTLALFYGHISIRARSERERSVRDQEVALELERLVRIRTQEANEKAQAMEALYQQAEEASRLKSEFVASMSHEFLSPLHVILGYGELLAEGLSGELDAAARNLLDRMQHNARRLLAMVTNVLDLAKADAGATPLFPGPVDLTELAADLVDLATLPHPPQLSVRAEVRPALPTPITDSHKLRLIIGHLLSNAVKFTPNGEVVLEVAFDAERERVDFTVSDTGIGIHPEDLATIFQDFRQLDGSLRRRYEGGGLGLALVHRYAKILGGSLSVSSVPKQGSRFTFSLPLTHGERTRPVKELPVREVA